MPLVKKTLTVAAGATSDQILSGTTYEYVDAGTRLIVAAAVDVAEADGDGVVMRFNVNNSELSESAEVSALVDGEAFGWRGGYVMNDTVTQAGSRNRPIITFTNQGSDTRTVHVAIFIGF